MIDPLNEATRPISEFADRLGVHVNTLKRAAARGELEVIRLAGTRTTETAVRRWIESRSARPISARQEEGS